MKIPFTEKLAKVPVYRLRQVLNFLQIKEYLVVTSDEYAIVKPERMRKRFLNDGETVMMKLPKEQESEDGEDLRHEEAEDGSRYRVVYGGGDDTV